MGLVDIDNILYSVEYDYSTPLYLGFAGSDTDDDQLTMNFPVVIKIDSGTDTCELCQYGVMVGREIWDGVGLITVITICRLNQAAPLVGQ